MIWPSKLVDWVVVVTELIMATVVSSTNSVLSVLANFGRPSPKANKSRMLARSGFHLPYLLAIQAPWGPAPHPMSLYSSHLVCRDQPIAMFTTDRPFRCPISGHTHTKSSLPSVCPFPGETYNLVQFGCEIYKVLMLTSHRSGIRQLAYPDRSTHRTWRLASSPNPKNGNINIPTNPASRLITHLLILG